MFKINVVCGFGVNTEFFTETVTTKEAMQTYCAWLKRSNQIRAYRVFALDQNGTETNCIERWSEKRR